MFNRAYLSFHFSLSGHEEGFAAVHQLNGRLATLFGQLTEAFEAKQPADSAEPEWREQSIYMGLLDANIDGLCRALAELEPRGEPMEPRSVADLRGMKAPSGTLSALDEEIHEAERAIADLSGPGAEEMLRSCGLATLSMVSARVSLADLTNPNIPLVFLPQVGSIATAERNPTAPGARVTGIETGPALLKAVMAQESVGDLPRGATERMQELLGKASEIIIPAGGTPLAGTGSATSDRGAASSSIEQMETMTSTDASLEGRLESLWTMFASSAERYENTIEGLCAHLLGTC